MKYSIFHSLIIFLLLMALTFSSVGVTPAYAATFTVTTTSNNGAGCLRQAFVDAPSGSTTPSMPRFLEQPSTLLLHWTLLKK
jgi:hypothetical protein